jgi:hypothetical protein
MKSITAEFSNGGPIGRKSATAQEDPILYGTGSATESQVPITLEREVGFDLL